MGEYRSGPLGRAGGQLWDKLHEAYEFSPAETEIVYQACATADVIDWLDTVLASEPLVVRGRYGQVTTHPALASIAAQRKLLADLLKQLHLPDEGTAEVPLPDDVPRLPRKEAADG